MAGEGLSDREIKVASFMPLGRSSPLSKICFNETSASARLPGG
jgi:hypothetical protein